MKKRKTILVAGSLNMDLVASARRLPGKGETVFGDRFATFPGGKGANQAVAAGKLGADVRMVGCVGKDGFGAQLLESLKKSDVDARFVEQVDNTTGTALITVDAEGSNTIVVIGGANNDCVAAHIERALAAATEPGLFVLQHEIPSETVEYAIKAAKAKGWTVILNPAPARTISAEALALVDILVPNETELAVLTSMPTDSEEAVKQAVHKLLAQGVGTVLVTMGAKGAICCGAKEEYRVKPYQVQAVDTTAAGDAYIGALATALAEGKPLRDSMDFASASAALSVTKEGAQPSLPRRAEVNDFMNKVRLEK